MAGDPQLGRRARITISSPVAGSYSKASLLDVLVLDAGDEQGPGLRCVFKITKTSDKAPNTSKLDIYNLNSVSRARLQGKGSKVLIEAGYAASGLVRIFWGDVRVVDHIREGANWITRFQLADGERSFRWAQCDESFAAGTSAEDVLRFLAGASGLDVGNVPEANITTTFDQGYVVSGSVQTAITRLVKSLGLAWSIQDGALQVLAPGQSIAGAIPLDDTDSGLLDSPEMGAPEKKGKPALVKYRRLLSACRPGARRHLKSERYDGEIVIKKCDFNGDTHGDQWEVEIQGVIHV